MIEVSVVHEEAIESPDLKKKEPIDMQEPSQNQINESPTEPISAAAPNDIALEDPKSSLLKETSPDLAAAHSTQRIPIRLESNRPAEQHLAQ